MWIRTVDDSLLNLNTGARVELIEVQQGYAIAYSAQGQLRSTLCVGTKVECMKYRAALLDTLVQKGQGSYLK